MFFAWIGAGGYLYCFKSRSATISRVSEATHARRVQVDFKNNIWLIEAEDMKAN